MQVQGAVTALVVVALWVCAVADVISADELRTRRLSKAAWLKIVLLLPIVGGGWWVLLGRPLGSPRSTGPGFRTRRRTLDTEEFTRFVAGLRRASSRE